MPKTDDTHPMPCIGLGLEPEHPASALIHQKLFARLAPQHFTLWHDLRQRGSEHLKQAAELMQCIDITIELQAFISDESYKDDIAMLAAHCHNAGTKLSAIHVAPAMYLCSFMPTGEFGTLRSQQA